MSDIYKTNIRNTVFAYLQGHFVGSQFLITNLNSEKESTFLKVSGSEFHIIGLKYLTESDQSILY